MRIVGAGSPPCTPPAHTSPRPTAVFRLNLPPLSLYIHIPWCRRKCPYCDFNSHAVEGRVDEEVYIDAMLRDLEADLPLLCGRSFETIFIGGGTPSLFSADAIGCLLEGVGGLIDCTQASEITLEANPGALETERFSGYREAGVTRLSLGVQSLNAPALQALGRIHGPQQAIDAVTRAKQAGFKHINLDMMFGLPQQTPAMAMEDLASVIELGVGHLSYYQLTLEPNTPFHHTPPPLPDEETLWRIQQQGHAMLAQAGFEHYEISAFARQGEKCRHNLNYWRFGDYLGIGAGAHAKVTAPDGVIKRFWKYRHPSDYLAAGSGSTGYIQGERTLLSPDLLLEFMMNALRLSAGVETTLLQATTGLPVTAIRDLLNRAVARGLILPVNERLRPTPLGRRFLNDLLAIFQVKSIA
ncbi:MAG: radical SAM family heme chaperone HemW [Candidatus Thiodiazotropha sp. (ex Epidulcina cf. delphinae)]|nr:radical SAM family heme chaperone HemW [Candidatus Thiodiazotropha sp. (ex Epidulcina cf. delphinae)]